MARNRNKEQRLEQERISKGKCRYHIDIDIVPGTTMCESCLFSRREKKKKLNEQGKCRNHPLADVMPGKTSCQQCINASAQRAKNRQDNGFCVNHPDRPLSNGKRNCDECMEKINWRRIKLTYDITKEQYFVECEKRNYQCDICKIKCLPAGGGGKKSKVFQIDHNHKTGKVRGFLCQTCNILLGQFYEDKKRMSNFIDNLFPYLDNKDLINLSSIDKCARLIS